MLTTALVSAFTGIPIRPDIAMTGETSLRGRAMRIGGLKEKLLAAHRGGIKLVFIPQENVRDLAEIPDNGIDLLVMGAYGHSRAREFILGGVTRRFPQLTFGFLEGGAAWALNLLNDIVEHWEKRNVDHLEKNLDPSKVDVPLMVELFDKFGNKRLTSDRIRTMPFGPLSKPERPANFNEFDACGMTEIDDLGDLFVKPFYFGCEADDRMSAVAFDTRLNHFDAKIKAVFGSLAERVTRRSATGMHALLQSV